MNLFKQKVKTVSRAACPCGCEVVNRMMLAHHVGGDGASVSAQVAGETVRCCSCGTVFTVTASGSVIVPKRLAVERRPTPQDTRTRGWGTMDEDIADLEARLPPV